MRRVLVLLCAIAFSLPAAKLFAQDGDEGKGSGNEVLRYSDDSRGSFPGGPVNKSPLSTGYYVVDNDAPAVGAPWAPTYNFVDTTGAEAQYWNRIVSGPNQRTPSYWTRQGSQGYEYFRNPNQMSPGPNGTVITDSTDNAIAGPISIGFPYYYYGRRYDSFYVSTNGLIALTNRRYQYKEDGSRIAYEAMSDNPAPLTANAITDPVADNYGYNTVVLDNSTNVKAGLLNPDNTAFPTPTFSKPYIAALWEDTEMPQYNALSGRPDDFGKVYWRRDTLNNQLLIYYVNQSMVRGKNFAPVPARSPQFPDPRGITATYEVVLDRIDSTVQINYKKFNGAHCIPASPICSPSAEMFRSNATIAVMSHDGEYTNYLYNVRFTPGALYTNGALTTPHDGLAIRFHQWKNVVRVRNVAFQIPSPFVPGKYTDLPAGQLVDNYELLLGNTLLGTIRPVGVVQNVSDSIGPVNKTPQPIRFNVVFRIRDLINTNYPPIYQRTATTDSLYSIRINSINPAKRNQDTIVFDPYVTNAQVLRQVGRFRAEVIALDQGPSGESYGQEWPFDDTTGVRLFGIRRLEAPFIDAFNTFDFSPEDGIIPSVQQWVSIGAQVVDGDARTNNPPPPRGPQTVNNRTLNSPVALLDRMDNGGGPYNNDQIGVVGGDTLLSFPINLSQLVINPVLTMAYQRAGRQPGVGTYDRGWGDNQRVGPENAVYNTAKDQIVQQPDRMLVEFAEPSPDGLNNIVNLSGLSNWRYASFRDNGVINWGATSPRWGVFGGGGGSGFDQNGKIIVDEFDAGKDFEFYRAYIPIPSRWAKVAPGNKTFRFRIRLEVKNDKNPAGNPADDDDAFFVDNVMLTEPAKPEVEVTAVRVDWPYSQAPASQARQIPLSVKIGNNGATAATTFGVAMFVERDPQSNPNPPGLYNYYRYRSIISVAAGRDYVENFPTWNAQECGSQIIPDTLNPITTTKYRISARIQPSGFDSYNANDETYTDFTLRLGPTFAYDDGNNDVPGEAALLGKGLNLVPPTNQDGAALAPYGPLGGSSSGTFAMQFRVLTRDTVRGYQAYFAGANQAQDFILYSIYKQPAGTNVNNPPSGLPVASTLAYARRGEGIPTTRIPGRLFHFDQFVTYMLDTPYVVDPGIYFATVAQLGETGLELGADGSRMGQVTTIVNPPPAGGPTGGIGNYSIPAQPEMRQNRFWYEVTTQSSNWNPMLTQVNNPGYPHLDFAGTMPIGFPTHTRGSWIPMIRPYFGIKGSSECLVEPVELADFKLTALSNALRLDWTTATEINNHGFYVERREKGAASTWSDLTFKAGAGTSNQVREYDYVDNNVAVNTTYQYRLRQEDRDGSVNYSDVKEGRINSAEAGSSNELSQNTPNPVTTGTRIGFTVANGGTVRVEISDIYGNVIWNQSVETKAGDQGEVFWNGNDANGVKVANGTYIYKLVGEGVNLSRKMTVAR